MPYNPEIHNRHSIRLKGYDYSQAGAYFFTLCVQDKTCLFGEIMNARIALNAAGEMVEFWWHELGKKFPMLVLDQLVIMPNHIHGIVFIRSTRADLTGLPAEGGQPASQGAHTGAPLPNILQWFKTMSTNNYIRGVKESDWLPFPKRLWQRGYYERIIRDEDELGRARKYIAENPLKWVIDEENPYA